MRKVSKPKTLQERVFQNWLNSEGIDFIPEHRFNPDRRWRFDYAFPDLMIAVEIEGGVWIQGRHSRGMGMINDMEKYNWAVLHGWRVLRYTPQQLGNAIRDLQTLKGLS
jgi:very-short-patch-repair endonuclease